MSEPRSRPVDPKTHIRDELDLRTAEWRRVGSADVVGTEGAQAARVQGSAAEVEYAFVPHTDGVTYVAMRQSSGSDGVILVFTPSEWAAFVAGVRDGEFDDPCQG